MRILFMGTPGIAAACLETLAAAHTVVGVLCQPDKPVGRKYILTPPPVKVTAEAQGLAVYQPESLRDGAILPLLEESRPEAIVVVAYGKLLPPYVLDFPRFGCINLHVSLLPKYRGAAPMQRAILAGERESGVTVMYMAEGMDTGDILLQERFPIAPEDDLGAITDRSAKIGGRLLLEALSRLESGTAPRLPQCEAEASVAAKITPEDQVLDFSESAEAVLCRIRALSPAPLAFCRTPDGKKLKVLRALPGEGEDGYGRLLTEEAPPGRPGEVLALAERGRGGITVACGAGTVVLETVLPEGRAAMSAADFIRGRKVALGDLLQ